MARPHVIFHLGQDKTGSTAIQRALARCDGVLQDAGVLFPAPGKHANHQIMMPALSGRLPDDPVQMQTLARSPDAAWRAAEAQWQAARQRLARGDIRRLILSSEIEFRPWQAAEVTHLGRVLAEVSDSVEVVAYLRPPASYMMSVIQQDLKKRPAFRPISASRYRDALEPFLMQGPGQVRAIAFDRKTLAGGDVVTDFCTRFVPEIPADTIAAQAEHDNESISAEAISVLQDYFRDKVAAPHPWYARRPQRFKRLVMAADAVVPGYARPRLRPGLAEVAQARAHDLDWLAETFGIDFHGDTGGLTRAEAEAAYQALSDIEHVTEVDAARRDALLGEMQRIARREQAPVARLMRVLGRR